MNDQPRTAGFTPATLTAYLHDHIPLTAAMGLRAEVVEWGGVRLSAPITPNLNHNRTAFGGSISGALVMAGWSLTHNRLRSCGYYAERPDTQLVVSRSEVRFLRPIDTDFRVECRHEDTAAWDHFLECLTRKSRAKLRVTATAGPPTAPDAVLKASFVAITGGD